MKDYASIGTCRICGQGRVIVARENATTILYVLCEECESEWKSPPEVTDINVATQNQRGLSTLLERSELAGHLWEMFLEK